MVAMRMHYARVSNIVQRHLYLSMRQRRTNLVVRRYAAARPQASQLSISSTTGQSALGTIRSESVIYIWQATVRRKKQNHC